jgi:hypothetical protein
VEQGQILVLVIPNLFRDNAQPSPVILKQVQDDDKKEVALPASRSTAA